MFLCSMYPANLKGEKRHPVMLLCLYSVLLETLIPSAVNHCSYSEPFRHLYFIYWQQYSTVYMVVCPTDLANQSSRLGAGDSVS